ncbi:MAG TPA: FAD-binding protein, partial [Rhodanobacter sp.]|nr:FAD-binding protein [Rhodanobacter sp.]
MHRRDLLKAALAAPLLSLLPAQRLLASTREFVPRLRRKVRPGEPGWPSEARWDELRRRTGGRLQKLQSPFDPEAPAAVRAEAVKHLKNPFYLGDQPALTQTSGWADAWLSRPSVYAVAAETAADVAAAVDFAREHRLRLVVKGGGHSYQGTSDAPDSLLVWTRHMNQVRMHDDFVPRDCAVAPQPAVSVGAGAMWIDAYSEVTTRGGRYVQGGGCTTVGVAGLVQSGGFGSFSKRWGTAASNLLEAEVVTADGRIRVVNENRDPDLFWAIKGGGGGSLGVVTRLTLRTFELPAFFGGVFGAIKASSPAAFRALIAEAMRFYRDALFNPHWGEQMSLRDGDTLAISMVFQGLTKAEAETCWAPFMAWVTARPEYTVVEPLKVLALPARHFWDAEFFRQHAPGLMVADDRTDAPRNHVLWAGDQHQVGWFIHAYQSAWLSATLLETDTKLVDALFTASQAWEVELHFNKGLAGGVPDAIERAHDTAMHPDVLGAFALAIISSSGDPAYPGLHRTAPDLAKARRDAGGVDQAMAALRNVAPGAGSYVSESDYFLRDWQHGFWGTNYPRLARTKQRHDPDG